MPVIAIASKVMKSKASDHFVEALTLKLLLLFPKNRWEREAFSKSGEAEERVGGEENDEE